MVAPFSVTMTCSRSPSSSRKRFIRRKRTAGENNEPHAIALSRAGEGAQQKIDALEWTQIGHVQNEKEIVGNSEGAPHLCATASGGTRREKIRHDFNRIAQTKCLARFELAKSPKQS